MFQEIHVIPKPVATTLPYDGQLPWDGLSFTVGERSVNQLPRPVRRVQICTHNNAQRVGNMMEYVKKRLVSLCSFSLKVVHLLCQLCLFCNQFFAASKSWSFLEVGTIHLINSMFTFDVQRPNGHLRLTESQGIFMAIYWLLICQCACVLMHVCIYIYTYLVKWSKTPDSQQIPANAKTWDVLMSTLLLKGSGDSTPLKNHQREFV